MSHFNAQVVTGVVNKLQEEYGKETPLTVSRGKKHEYLGMVIDYSRDGEVIIAMFDFKSNVEVITIWNGWRACNNCPTALVCRGLEYKGVR